MNKDVWNRIDSVLQARRKSWTSLAQDLGYTDQRISNWRHRGVPAQAFSALSSHLGISLQWLITGEGVPSAADGPIAQAGTPTSEYDLSKEEKMVLHLWRGLTKEQQKQCLQSMEDTKRANEVLLLELTAAKVRAHSFSQRSF